MEQRRDGSPPFIGQDLELLFSASSHISLFVWEHSPGWPVLFCTDNVERLLGFSRQDYEQRNVTYVDNVHPADLSRVAEEVHTATQDSQCAWFTHEDYRMIRADGEEIWVSDTTVVERDSTGQVKHLTGYLLDITERKRLELALAAEHQHLASVIESARLASWNWHVPTSLVSFNARWWHMLGLETSAEQQPLSCWHDRIHLQDRPQWEAAIQAHLQGQTSYYEQVYRIRHQDGRWLYVLDRGQVVAWDSRQKPLRFTGTQTDITAQKEAELAAQDTARARSRMLANISHEIRTPLHGILGLASVLEQQSGDAHQRLLLQTIRESGDYLLNTLNDALDLSRVEAGKLELMPEPTSLPEVSRHLENLFSVQAEAAGLDFQISVSEQIPERVRVDRKRLLQILINLLNNAFKFTREGHVYLTVNWSAAEPAGLRFEVADSGAGIRDKERIWQLFEQDHASSHQAPGSGVGLAVVRDLVDLMAGHITVESEPEQGSRFRLELPAQAVANTEPAVREATRLSNLLILVVDDSEVNQLVLAEMLSRLQLRFVTVSTGPEAIELARQQTFDLILMDLHMPGQSGLDTIGQLRQTTPAHGPVIALSADTSGQTQVAVRATGVQHFLAKPFSLRELEQVLEHAITHNP